MNISRQVFLLFKLFETTIKILNNKQQRHKQPLKHDWIVFDNLFASSYRLQFCLSLSIHTKMWPTIYNEGITFQLKFKFKKITANHSSHVK